MTDENKLAEEYRKSLWQRLTDEDDFERLGMFDENVEEAFLAGLEAGRPKWHKVADGDLPPEDTDVLALLADKEIYMAHFYRRNVWDKIVPVIAWCEIPLYEEE